LKEFQAFRTPEENRLFTELYNVQHMQSNTLDDVSRVCTTTIQRLSSMLKGEELDPALEEESTFTASALLKEPVPVIYNPKLPIETFDFIITDECHRSIYHLWRHALAACGHRCAHRAGLVRPRVACDHPEIFRTLEGDRKAARRAQAAVLGLTKGLRV
jgi:type I site-specific restriction endonuclease